MVRENRLEGLTLSAVCYSIGVGFILLGIVVFGIGLYYEYLTAVSIGLAFLSVGIGLVALWLGRASDERMKALARLEFREKIAMICGYIASINEPSMKNGFIIEKITQDFRSALELKRWIAKDEKKYELLIDFKASLQTFITASQASGNTYLTSRLIAIQEEINTI